MKKVFISYRREDTQAIAGRLYDGLEARLGASSVFFDIDSIPLGTDFREQVRGALDDCGVLLVLIGPRWLDVSHKGQRRLDDPQDFVRVEVEAALERRVPIVPVLVDQTAMPSADQLPDTMKALSYRNAVRLDSGIDFRNHLARLVAGIRPLVEPLSANTGAASGPTPVAAVAAPSAGPSVAPALAEAPPAPPERSSAEHSPAVLASAPESAVFRPTRDEGESIPLWRRSWMVACAGATVAAIVFVTLSVRLSGAADEIDSGLRSISLPQPQAPNSRTLPHLSVLLVSEVASGLIAITNDGTRSVLSLQTDKWFETDTATLIPARAPTLRRLADVLRDRPEKVVVTGHTDNTTRRTAKYPSNFHLSRERAEAVAGALVQAGLLAGRVQWEGLGDSMPTARNDTPEGRRANRRIEIGLPTSASDKAGTSAKGGS